MCPGVFEWQNAHLEGQIIQHTLLGSISEDFCPNAPNNFVLLNIDKYSCHLFAENQCFSSFLCLAAHTKEVFMSEKGRAKKAWTLYYYSFGVPATTSYSCVSEATLTNHINDINMALHIQSP
ncbi:uncharacterized protein NEMAJ01_2263 [Nematocida major]|uniref:uncharacterized protein n=1 Tax=Nematocida major TaxID=1912982 RepID=UPI002007C4D1|nr:uncharacterized protein NEMAJ01_2263 [Nematocida major]KAH9387367.1 hypothetical protein NEMAJ01_2263 [Nematocida major]